MNSTDRIISLNGSNLWGMSDGLFCDHLRFERQLKPSSRPSWSKQGIFFKHYIKDRNGYNMNIN